LDHYVLTSEQLQKILRQIDQALVNHNAWYSEFIRSITCKLPTNEEVIDSEPHKKCNFGKWFYSIENEIPSTHHRFTSIEKTHKVMHQLAAKLLLESQEHDQVSVLDYDNFSKAIEDMRIELNNLKHEFETLLYEHDSLTGATTRLGILPTLKEQLELIQRGVQSDCCIAMMDLDNFKMINDSFGHPAGDHVLSSVIQYVIEQLRPYDKVFRYGGEEFIILMQQTDLTAGYTLIERLRKGIQSLSIKVEGNNLIQVTASFGVVKLDPNLSVENSIELADKAMYKAKASGRNIVNIGY
jgi:diguanylate cyclase (GGDEF)-like protein